MNKRTLLWLGVVLIIAGFLRFSHLTTTPPGLYPDEAVDGIHALHAFHTGQFKVFYTENNGEEGLFAAVEAFFIAISGGIHDPWILRLPSAVFGFFTVLGTFFVARELFRKHRRHDLIGLLAAFFVATSFWHINFSRIGFRAIMAPFFLAWAIYFLLKSIRAAQTRWNPFHAAVGGIFFGLGFYSYISYRITPLLLLLAIPFFRKEKGFWRGVSVFLIATFIVALPLGLYFLRHPADFFGRTSQVSVMNAANPPLEVLLNTAKTLGMLNVQGDGNWRHNISGRPELFWPVGIAFWIGVVLGLLWIFKKNPVGGRSENKERSELKFAYLISLAWIALAALPVIFSDEGIPHALRGILMIPPIMVLAAVGGAQLYEWLARKFPPYRVRIDMIGFAVLAFILIVESYAYFVTWAQSPAMAGAFTTEATRLGSTLRDIPSSRPKYIIDNAGGGKIPSPDGWDPGDPFEDHSIFLQPAMFMTDTYEPESQRAQNLHYIFPSEESTIPSGAAAIQVNWL